MSRPTETPGSVQPEYPAGSHVSHVSHMSQVDTETLSGEHNDALKSQVHTSDPEQEEPQSAVLQLKKRKLILKTVPKFPKPKKTLFVISTFVGESEEKILEYKLDTQDEQS